MRTSTPTIPSTPIAEHRRTGRSIRRLVVLLLAAGTVLSRAIPVRPALEGAGKLAGELVEMAARVSGRHLDDAARLAARESVERGLTCYGDDIIRGLLKKGGVELAEAAARNGDDIWRFAREVPQASRVLAIHADQLVPLTRRLGTKVLEMEARSAGSGRALVRIFGEADAATLLKATSTRTAGELVVLAEHATPETRAVLARTFLETRNQKHFVEILEKSWKPILAGGLGVAMITAAHEAADGVQTAFVHHPEVATAVLERGVDRVAFPIAVAVGLVVLLVGLRLSRYALAPARALRRACSAVARFCRRLVRACRSPFDRKRGAGASSPAGQSEQPGSMAASPRMSSEDDSSIRKGCES